jgi:hypothetical protein
MYLSFSIVKPLDWIDQSIKAIQTVFSIVIPSQMTAAAFTGGKREMTNAPRLWLLQSLALFLSVSLSVSLSLSLIHGGEKQALVTPFNDAPLVNKQDLSFSFSRPIQTDSFPCFAALPIV